MLRTRSFSFLLALVAPVVVAILPGAALAEPPPQDAPGAPAPPPTTKLTGTFQRYVMAPSGRPMGLMLSNGAFVHTPGRTLLPEGAALSAGDALQIEGVAVKTPVGMFVSRAVVAHAGAVIADAGARRGHHGHKGHHGHHHGKRHAELVPVSAAGKVAVIIATPRSRVLAVVLDDGTTAVAPNLGSLGLKVGDRISIAGKGGVYPLGKALRIEKITLPSGEIRDIPPRVRPQAPTQSPA
jgi:hypothetical protein